jgi:hypothetical protein
MSPLRIELEKKLIELGLSYRRNDDGFYSISNHNGGGNHTKVQLELSLQPVIHIHDSKNGVDVQAIGLFKFKFPLSGNEPDLFIFAFQNLIKNHSEFLIIPTQEFERRHVKMHSGSVRRKSVNMVCWLMHDGSVFDTTNISVEGEWYLLSKGVNGRMANGSEIDYSTFLNCWRRLIV